MRHFSALAASFTMGLLTSHAPAQDLRWQPLEPPAREGHGMVSTSGGAAVLFGGSGRTDTWRWSGADWALLDTSGPNEVVNEIRLVHSGWTVLYGTNGNSRPFGNWELYSTNQVQPSGFWREFMPQNPTNLEWRCRPDFGQSGLCITGAPGPTGTWGSTWVLGGGGFENVAGSNAPTQARSGYAIAGNLLFGGDIQSLCPPNPVNAQYLGDIWQWNGQVWSPLSPAQSPSPRAWHDMCGEPGNVLMFGGEGAGADVWRMPGTQLGYPANTGPSARSRHAMVGNADSALLFGGRANSGGAVLGDTWLWQASTQFQNFGSWSRWTATPGARLGAGMAYDQVRRRLVMFGGTASENVAGSADLHEFDGNRWIRVVPDFNQTWPTGRSFHAMTWHPGSQKVVIFGGTGNPGSVLGDAWAWDGAAWTQLPSGPPGRTQCAMAGLGRENSAVLVGGEDFSANRPTTVWTLRFDTGTQQYSWSGPQTPLGLGGGGNSLQRIGHAMASDPTTGYAYVFGGFDASNNRLSSVRRSLNGRDWETQSSAPVALSYASLTFDSGRNKLVIFGGQSASGFTTDYYEYTPPSGLVGTWSQVTSVSNAPQTRRAHAAGFHPETGKFIVFGGRTPTTVLGDTQMVRRGAAPLILQQPQGLTTCFGGAFSLTVQVSGGSVQWEKDGVPVVNGSFPDGSGVLGANTPMLTIAFGQPDRSGVYVAAVTNGQVTVRSQPVVVTVLPGPSFTQQPADVTATLGSATAIVFTGVGGSGATYQWFKGAQPVGTAQPLTSGQPTSLPFASISAADAGTYTVRLNNSCTDVTSRIVTVTVQQGPAISQQPVSRHVCDGTLTAFSVAATGTPPLFYQWRRNGVNLADSPLYTGTRSSTMLVIAGGSTAGVFDCVVTNASGQAISLPASLTIVAAPQIGQQNVGSLTVCEGARATMFVNVSTAGAVSYQWRKGTPRQAIGGATSSILNIDNAGEGDAGVYDCVVTNACGQSVTASPTTLTVRAGISIVEGLDDTIVCVGASQAFSVQAVGSGLTYQWYFGGAELAGQTGPSITLPGLAAADNGKFVTCIVTDAVCGGQELTSAQVIVRSGPAVVIINNNSVTCSGQTISLSASVSNAAGNLLYNWRRNGVSLGQNVQTLVISPATAGDAGNYDCVVGDACGSGTSNTIAIAFGQGVTINPIATPLEFCTLPQTITVLSNTSGAGPITLQWYKRVSGMDEVVPGATSSSLSRVFNTQQDVTNLSGEYFLRATNPCGSVDSNLVSIRQPQAPQVTLPSSLATCPNGYPSTVTIEAQIANPQEVTSILWFRNGVLLPGETQPTLTRVLNSAADHAAVAGAYLIRTSTLCGSVDRTCVVSIQNPTTITVQPSDVTLCGAFPQFGSLNIAASGTGPLTYQWFKDGQPVASVNFTAFNAAQAQGFAGTYVCRVSGPCFTVDSAPAQVIATPAPVFTQQPQNQTVIRGQPATFSAGLQAPPLTTYEWRRNAQPLPNDPRYVGVSTTTLIITQTAAGDAGQYSLFTGGPGCLIPVQSNSAVLTLRPPGDVNGDGQVSVQDIFDYLNIYFAGGAGSDFNGDGQTSVQDLFDFLTAYFAG